MHTACYTLVTLRKLLLRAGDIEANPAPSGTVTRSDLCIIHLNARSIKNKIDLTEAEANQFDIITVPPIKPVLNWANVCSPEHTSDTSTNYDSFLN